jgi:hypothetical protein
VHHSPLPAAGSAADAHRSASTAEQARVVSSTDPQHPSAAPDPLDLASVLGRDPRAPGGTGDDDVNDVLPLPNDPRDGGLSGDDLNGETPD